MTFGTGHHGKGVDGRSKQIEGYISKTVEWIIKEIGIPLSVLGLGCDYGFELECFKRNGSTVFGVDAYFEKNPFDIPILREDIASPILLSRLPWKSVNLVMMNHSLEHVTNPHAVLQNVKTLQPDHVFIAVPHCKSVWATWDSHMSAWTGEFLDHVAEMHGFEKIVQNEISFRDGLVEIWRIYK